MKILVVTDSVNIEDSSGSKANVAIIKNLVATGFEVVVYHYTRKDIHIDGATCVSISEIRNSTLFFMSRLQRYFTIYTKLNINNFIEGKLGFSLVYLNDSKSMVKALKKCNSDFDLVMTLSKGGSFRPHHSMLKIPKFHSKWLAYMHDPYPMHFYPSPYNWIETSYRQKENFVRQISEKARWSAFPSLLLKDWMSSYYPNFLMSGIIIPHQNAKYEIKNTTLPSYFETKKFNVLHAGNLLATRPPQGFIEGFLMFLNKNPDAKKDAVLLHIGSAYQVDYLQKHQSNPNLILILNSVNFDEVYNLQMHASVNVILESKSEISPFLPAKFPHCIAANKPILVLGPFYSETRRLLGNDYEFCCEVDDVRAISQQIENLYFIWKDNPSKLQLNRPDLEKYLSAENLKNILSNEVK